MEKIFHSPVFDWDPFNIKKNWGKHGVKYDECEEVFFDENMVVFPDPTHSETEIRWIALGRTKDQRPLFVVFTERDKKIRVISARDMHRKERKVYHEKAKRNS